MEEESSLLHYSIFDIDIDEEEPSTVSFEGETSNEFELFLKRLATNTRVAKSTREAEFDKDSQMREFLAEYIKTDESEEITQKIARKLLKAENINSKKMNNLAREIKKGSLIIAIFNIGNEKHLLLSKIDFEKFFERETFEKKLGLPEDNSLLKSCLIKVSSDNSFGNPLLYDTNSKISQFWREGFLETQFIRDDKVNTEKAYALLNRAVSYLKKESNDDHRQIKNNLISYFTTTENYNHDEMLDRVVGDYEPVKEGVDVDKIREKLNKVADQKKFDGNFKIEKSAIKDKIKKTYPLDNDVSLVANAGTHTIFRAKYRNESYVMVKSKVVPDDFKEIKLEN